MVIFKFRDLKQVCFNAISRKASQLFSRRLIRKQLSFEQQVGEYMYCLKTLSYLKKQKQKKNK